MTSDLREASGGIRTHRDLEVWKQSFQLAQDVYRLTGTFPADAQRNLADQARRSSLSIPSNIAEGAGRGSRQEYRRFVEIAKGSGAELETQLLLAKALGYADEGQLLHLLDQLAGILKMLSSLQKSLS